MPLTNYGVAIGTFVKFTRDPPDEFGKWYHGHLSIQTPSGIYQSALDVDTPSGIGVSYTTLSPLTEHFLPPISSLSNGWHSLASTSKSGALDYVRNPLLLSTCRWPVTLTSPGRVIYTATRISSFLRWWFCMRLFSRAPDWIPSTGDNALTMLEQILPNSQRIFIFGEHYDTGLGVHDVHQNQGDPPGSQWYASNGIWQDGGVIAQLSNGSYLAWLVRFNSQATNTDSNGHPV